MSIALPTIEDFKTFFDRGQFSFGEDLPNVRDKDITQAQSEALAAVGDCSDFGDSSAMAFNYLTAHFLLNDINAADTGGTGMYPVSSHSAGGLSEGFAIPQKFMNNPLWNLLSTTYYGRKFLAMAYSLSIGRVGVVGGRTLP